MERVITVRITPVEVAFNVATSHCEQETGFEGHPVGTIWGKLGYSEEIVFVGCGHNGVLAGANNLIDENMQ